MTTERIPPHSEDAEQATLGAILLDWNCAAGIGEILTGAMDFYSAAHRKIYAASMDLVGRSQPADITTVSEELERRQELTDCGGRAYLAGLAAGVATTANAEYYAKIVLEKAQLRRTIDIAGDIVDRAYRQEDDAAEIIAQAEADIFSITDRRDRKSARSISDILPEVFETINKRHEAGGQLVGVATGFIDVDHLLGGIAPGDLVIVAGRPGMGKSAWLLDVARNVAVSTHRTTAIYSLEMTDQSLALRALAGQARLNSKMVAQGKVNGADWDRLCGPEGMGFWADVPLYIDPTERLRPLELRAKVRRLVARQEVAAVFIDYLQLMDSDGRQENRNQEVTQISRSLKAIAKEFDLPVFVASQLNRAVEARGGNRRPQLSDLRESGAIEQDADIVMFVHRPEYYMGDLDPTDPKRMDASGKAEIIVAKHRNGETGIVELTFIKEYVRFENLTRQVREAAF